jgi:hypothetical protein
VKKKPKQRYDNAWRAAVHIEALAFLEKVRLRDAAAAAARAKAKVELKKRPAQRRTASSASP